MFTAHVPDTSAKICYEPTKRRERTTHKPGESEKYLQIAHKLTESARKSVIRARKGGRTAPKPGESAKASTYSA